MFAKGSESVCIICGKTGQVTREHVPPKGLFLSPRPTNTITVGLCAACNHGFHLDDEYFRVYVAAGAAPGSKLMRLWKEKVVGSSFVRGGGLKGRLNDDNAKLVEVFEPGMLETYDGLHIPKELLPRVQPFDPDRIDGVVKKMVLALRAHHGLPRIAENLLLSVDVTPLSGDELALVSGERSGEVGHENEFVYRCETDGDSESWILVFYETHSFRVSIRPAA